jgi:hypothetical protein
VERPVSKFCLPSTQNLRRYSAAGAYFVTLIIVGTYFIVSVFVAAISGVFLRLRKDHQVRSRFLGLLIG